MKRKLLCLFTILVIVAAGCLSGCGGCSCGEKHEDYYVPVDNGHQETDYSSMLPSEAELGVPVYTGNLNVSSISSSKEETDGEVTYVGVDYSTSDDFETVLAWYEDQLGEPKETQDLDGYPVVSWVLEKDGRQTMVVIQGKAEGTAISILNDKL